MRLLIIGTNRPCHKKLNDLGHDIVLLMPRRKMIPDDIYGPYEHIVAINDDAGEEEWIDIARAFHKKKRFDAIVPLYDRVQAVGHAIAMALDVKCRVDLGVLHRTSDKHAMRECLARHNIPSCAYRHAAGREQLGAAIGAIGFPCIVKPAAGEASEAVKKLTSDSDIASALAWIGDAHIDAGVIVEEFLEGDEFSVEAMSINGRHHIIAITKKYKDPQTFVEIGHLIPAPLSTHENAQITSYVADVLTALGFRDSPSHTELILTSDGPRIIETHTRLGGDKIPDLVNYATGVDLYELVALQGIGEDVSALIPSPIPSVQSAAVWYADPEMPQHSVLAAVGKTDTIRKLPYIKALEVLRLTGSSGTQVRNSFDRTARAIAVGADGEQAVQRAREAIQNLDLLYKWTPERAA